MARSTMVIPCYNEAARLDDAALLSLVDGDADGIALLLVDDGSRDETPARLAALAQKVPERIQALSMQPTAARRRRCARACRRRWKTGAEVVGYFDADLSTPVSEIRRLLAISTTIPRRWR